MLREYNEIKKEIKNPETPNTLYKYDRYKQKTYEKSAIETIAEVRLD